MRKVLQGNWLGHPLHSLLVHFPIALLSMGFVLDLLSFLVDWPDLNPAAFWILLFGILTGLIAAVPGMADFADIRRDAEARSTARIHMLLSIAALLLFGASVIVRYPHLEADQTPLPAFLLGLVGIAVLSYSGYIGGSLVYDDGVGVGRHRRAAPLPEKTVVKKSEPAAFVEVGHARDLPPGGSMRAEVNQTVIAILNLDGTFMPSRSSAPTDMGLSPRDASSRAGSNALGTAPASISKHESPPPARLRSTSGPSPFASATERLRFRY